MAQISVLMGTHNEKKEYVKQAIDSILGQTITDFEFIICDDASENDFFDWLEAYSKKDKRILLLKNEKNRGLSATLNRCLAHASGEYIARMDADDISEKNRFEIQKNFLDDHAEYAMTSSNVRFLDEHGIWGLRETINEPQTTDFLSGNPFVHPALMIRREVLLDMHGYSEEDYACRTEDYELFMRIYAKGYRGANQQTPLLLYREERSSFQKRKYRYRVNEAKVRYRGYRSLGILKGHRRFVMKPLIVGLIPAGLMRKIRTRKFGV